MRFDDGFTLRDSVQDFCDTVRYIVPHDVFDEQCRQRDTDYRRDEIPPCMTSGYQLLLHKALNEMNKVFQDSRSRSREHTYEEGQEQHEVLLADVTFPPIY